MALTSSTAVSISPKTIEERLRRIFHPSATSTLILAAIVIGILTGYMAVIFIWLIGYIEHVSFDIVVPFLNAHGFRETAIIWIPAAGSLVSGPLITFFAQEAKGHGVPEVMMALAINRGRMRPIVAVVKAAASSVCIGTGGSAGREGPIVQIGAVLGSLAGQIARMSDEETGTLVACGAGAGIAAVFNAPIAGAMFAMEVIAGKFSTFSFGNVVIAAVSASIVARHYLGAAPAFVVPAYTLRSPQELLLYAFLGIIAAFVAYAFVQALYFAEDLFDGWKFPDFLKPAIGGLMLGTVAYFSPYVLGTGLSWIENALEGGLAWKLMLAAILVKILGTSLTLGSGNSGGIFSPSLFMGAMLGGAFGYAVNILWPTTTAPQGAYALAGMGALFAGDAGAPLTSILMVFEMSGDYRMILPLMAATATSVVTYGLLSSESIYTLKLVRKGIYLQKATEIDVMQGVAVREVMTTNLNAVPPDMPLSELEHLFHTTYHHGFPVVDGDGKFIGLVTLKDLLEAKKRGIFARHTVGEIANTSPSLVYPDEPVWHALKLMGMKDVGRIPVVARDDPSHLLGMLRRVDVIRAYQRGIQKRLESHTKEDRMQLAHLTGLEVREFVVQPGAPVVGKPIKKARMPEGALLVTLRRGGNVVIIHGDVVLRPGDRVTALVKEKDIEKVQHLFSPMEEEKLRHGPFE